MVINPWDKYTGGTGSWEKNLRIATSNDLEEKLPAEIRESIIQEVFIPALGAEDISELTYFTTIQKGIDAIMARWNLPSVKLPTIVFAKLNTSPTYGFDAKTNDALSKYYNISSEGGKVEYIPWKSVEARKADLVNVRMNDSEKIFDITKLKFSTPTGTELSAHPALEKNTLQVSLIGGTGGDLQEVVATYPTSDTSKATVAKLNVVTYEKVPPMAQGAVSTSVRLDFIFISVRLLY